MELVYVERLLDRIHKNYVRSFNYNYYGFEEGYEKVPAKNLGYLPFYVNKDLKITEDILPDDSKLKDNRLRTETHYVVIHNTGMAHPSATAKGLNEYIHTTTRVASWHFSVDDKEAYQELKLEEVAWHAGDGERTFGVRYFNKTYNAWCIGGGNENSVAIEMCEYEGCNFNMVMRNTAKLVADILVHYNLKPSDVRQHHDFSGKNCPEVIRRHDRWGEMLELIELEYFAKVYLKGYEFVWKSLSPNMDDYGNVLVNDGQDQIVKYQVAVKFGEEEKTYEFESVVLGIK